MPFAKRGRFPCASTSRVRWSTSPRSVWATSAAATTALWEPEFLLGQLYSKGLFLLGYYDEILKFARAILEKRQPTRGTALHCWQIAHMFEKMLEGPGKTIELGQGP